MFTAEQKRSCLAREIALHKIVYPGRIKQGLMNRATAEHELAVMQAILDDYRDPTKQTGDLFAPPTTGDESK